MRGEREREGDREEEKEILFIGWCVCVRVCGYVSQIPQIKMEELPRG